MSKKSISKCKNCRRSGEKLFLKGDRCTSQKCAMIRKPYSPGMHGKKGVVGRSEYALQLAMKQKLKRIYGVGERQLRRYFELVKNKTGVTGDQLLEMLEMRLDNVIYLSGFAPSRGAARQLVSHSYFLLNEQRVNIPSIVVKVNDKIRLKTNKQKKAYFDKVAQTLKAKKEGDFPSWLKVDRNNFVIDVIGKPSAGSALANVNMQSIVEIYSR